jgi:hypothetical protein
MFNNVFIKTASGIAKNTPHIPHIVPKNKIEIRIARGWRLTASENRIGTTTFPSKIWISI